MSAPLFPSRAELGIWDFVPDPGVFGAKEGAEAMLAVEQVERAIRRLRELRTACATDAANERQFRHE